MSEQRYGATPADAYEDFMAPQLFAPQAEQIMGFVAVDAGENALDVACGTGVMTRRLAERVGASGRVIGLDIHPGMLATARARSSAPNIEWIEASALMMPLPNNHVDVIVCQQGLQFFPDRPAGLGEMKRVLKPHGRVAISTWARLDRQPGFHAVARALSKLTEATSHGLPPFSLGDANELLDLMDAAGFSDIQLRRLGLTLRFPSAAEFVRRIVAGAPTMLGQLASLDPMALDRLINDVTSELQPYTSADGLVMPAQYHLMQARL